MIRFKRHESGLYDIDVYDMDAIRADAIASLPADATPLDIALAMAAEFINANASAGPDSWECYLKIVGDRLHVCNEYRRWKDRETETTEVFVDIYPAGITPIESGKRTGRNGHPATEADREDKQRPDERVRSM